MADSVTEETATPTLNAHGYPDGTAVVDMAVEHQVAYWKHHSRKHESAAKSREDYDAIKAQLAELQAANATDAEKAVAAQVAEQVAKAKEEMLAALAPQLVAAEVKSQAVGKVADAQVESLLAHLDIKAFIKDGSADSEKVADLLKPFVTESADSDTSTQRRWPDMGQGKRGTQPSKPTGAEIYAARHKKNQQTTAQ